MCSGLELGTEPELGINSAIKDPPSFTHPSYIYRVFQSSNDYLTARSLANQPTHFSTILFWNLAWGVVIPKIQGYLFVTSATSAQMLVTSVTSVKMFVTWVTSAQMLVTSTTSAQMLVTSACDWNSLFYDKYWSSQNPNEHVEVGHSLDGTSCNCLLLSFQLYKFNSPISPWFWWKKKSISFHVLYHHDNKWTLSSSPHFFFQSPCYSSLYILVLKTVYLMNSLGC